MTSAVMSSVYHDFQEVNKGGFSFSSIRRTAYRQQIKHYLTGMEEPFMDKWVEK